MRILVHVFPYINFFFNSFLDIYIYIFYFFFYGEKTFMYKKYCLVIWRISYNVRCTSINWKIWQLIKIYIYIYIYIWNLLWWPWVTHCTWIYFLLYLNWMLLPDISLLFTNLWFNGLLILEGEQQESDIVGVSSKHRKIEDGRWKSSTSFFDTVKAVTNVHNHHQVSYYDTKKKKWWICVWM